MRHLLGLVAALGLLGAGLPALAQPTYNRVPPTCTYANRANCGAKANVNSLIIFSDSDTIQVGDTVAGSGANAVLAYCVGATNCYVVTGDEIPTSSALTGTTAGTFTINSDSGGGETATLDAGAADPITIGSADVTVITLQTDDTGDGTDVVLPADGVDAGEIGDTVCTQVVSAIFNPTEADTTTDFVSLDKDTTGANIFSATEGSQDNFIAPVAIKVNNLYAEVDTDPDNSGDDTAELWDIEISDDGADALSCQITTGNTTCTVSTASTAIAQGSRMNLTVSSVDDSGGNPPATAAEMWVSFCITPD